MAPTTRSKRDDTSLARRCSQPGAARLIEMKIESGVYITEMKRLKPLLYNFSQNGAFDVVGASPAAARVERCVYITNPLMVRPNGSPAPATARQRGFQLPLLIKMFCNQSCGNKHMDMLNLLLG